MVEKRLEVQGSMCLGFIVLEKAFDTVSREMVMTTTARVVVGEGASEAFEVKI